MQFDGPGGLAAILLNQDEHGERKRRPGDARIWTTRDRRERDEFCLLEDWHNSDMTLREFSERARGTRLDVSDVMWNGRPWKDPSDPRTNAKRNQPRTHRFWRRYRKRAGIPSYSTELQAAMKEAEARPAFPIVVPLLQALASAHDTFLRLVGADVADDGELDEEAPAADWQEILNAYDTAIGELLQWLPPGSVKHDSWAHDKHDPMYMAADLVLPPNTPAEISIENPPTAPAGGAENPTATPQDAAAVSIENHPTAGGDLPECLVTLQQAAAMVNRDKRTLERWARKKSCPRPRVLGGGGKPHEYAWSELRPFLEKQSGRKLPECFPFQRFRPV
jgi:hypothetical protein